MTADAMVRSNLLNGPQGLRWDAQDMGESHITRTDILVTFDAKRGCSWMTTTSGALCPLGPKTLKGTQRRAVREGFRLIEEPTEATEKRAKAWTRAFVANGEHGIVGAA